MVVPPIPEILELEKIFSPYETNDIHDFIRDAAPIEVKEAFEKYRELKLAKLSGGIAVTGYVAAEDIEVMTVDVKSIEVYASNTDETKTSSNVKKNLTAIWGEGNNAA